jgi:hypothetical protein
MSQVKQTMENLLGDVTYKANKVGGYFIKEFESKSLWILEEHSRVVDEAERRSMEKIGLERDNLAAEVASMQVYHEKSCGMVTINVGGHIFTTSVPTLRTIPGSFFDHCFNGRHPTTEVNPNVLFIDRDGHNFAHVLSYLRTGVLGVIEDGRCFDVKLLRELQREFKFFNIEVLSRTKTKCSTQYVFGGVTADLEPRGDIIHYAMTKENNDGDPDPFVVQNLHGPTWRSDFKPAWTLDAVQREVKTNTAVSSAEGVIVITGGLCYSAASEVTEHCLRAGYTRHLEISNSATSFNIARRTWTVMPALPEPRFNHAQIFVGSSLYILGGIGVLRGESCEITETLSSMYRFNSERGSWDKLQDLPDAISSFATCFVLGRIYVFGGVGDDNTQYDQVFYYDIKHDRWHFATTMPEGKHGHTVTEFDGLCYVVGGRYFLGEHSIATKESSRGHIFNPRISKWRAMAPLTNVRSHHATVVWNGNLCVLGGYKSDTLTDLKTAVQTTEMYTPHTKEWSASQNFPPPFDRSGFGVVEISEEKYESVFDVLIRLVENQKASLDARRRKTKMRKRVRTQFH